MQSLYTYVLRNEEDAFVFRDAQVLRHTRTCKKKKDRRQILRPSRVSRECLNVVYFTCVHMYFVRSMSSRIIGRKVWSNPLGEDFWGWFSPVDDNSLRVEIFGYRSNGIMQTENIFYIFFSLIERTKNIYIYIAFLFFIETFEQHWNYSKFWV